MGFWIDQRGQSLQLEFLLIGAILILAMAGYQAQVIPQQTAASESNAYETTLADVTHLRHAVLSVTTTSPTTATITTGATYPPRLFFQNPPAPRGQLTTRNLGPYVIRNATAVKPDTAEYWNGTARTVPTRDIRFQPDYNERTDAAPLRLSSGTVYVENENMYPLTPPVLVTENHIRLHSITGSVTAADSEQVVLDIEASATQTRTLTLANTSDPITVFVPTAIPAQHWRTELLAGEYDSTGNTSNTAYIRDIVEHPIKQGVRITFESNATYRLTLAHVHLSETSNMTAVPIPDPTYLTPVTPTSQAIDVGEYTTLTSEVRDRYNQPRSDITVTYTVTDGAENISVVTARSVRSTQDGHAELVVQGTQTGTANVTAAFGTGTARQTVTYTLTVDEKAGTVSP